MSRYIRRRGDATVGTELRELVRRGCVRLIPQRINGALARVALERALRCEPGYRLALLLEQMVDLAIRPTR